MKETNKTTRTSNDSHSLGTEAWPELSDSFIELMRENGTKLELSEGDVFFELGQDTYDFAYIEKGGINIVDRGSARTVVSIKQGQFLGEIGMLMGQKTFLAGVADCDSTLIRIPQERIRELVATVPEIGDIVVNAFTARRRLLMEWGEGGMVVVGNDNAKSTARLLEFLGRSRIPHRYVDISNTTEVNKLTESVPLPDSETIVIIGKSQVISDPSPLKVAEILGLDLVSDTNALFDVLVVGAGPAGLATSIYAASEGLKVLAIEDTAIGGQAGTSSKIENYFGFPTGISGGELAYKGEIQAIKFGARITTPRRAISLSEEDGLFTIGLNDKRSVKGRSVVLANGVQYRRLPLDRLADFESKGIYYAATVLETKYCKNTNVIIVGGGNSAGQAAMFLSRFARKTYIVVRGEGLSSTMSSYLSERILKDERIELLSNTQVSKLHGEDSLGAVSATNLLTNESRIIETSALFIMIGAVPNTSWLGNKINLDENGFILTGRDANEGASTYGTSQKGIYAVGDIRSGSVKRVASAVGEGSVVVSYIHQYLNPETA